MVIKERNYFTDNTLPAEGTFSIKKGEGIYFWDTNEKKYIDFSSQTLNLLLGQCHPNITKAVIDQAMTLTYASSRFGSLTYLNAVSKLKEILPEEYTGINIKMCDGSDANETAIKIARKYTGKSGIISFTHGHTGQTTQTIQLRGYERNLEILRGNLENVVFINPPKSLGKGDYQVTLQELKSITDNNNDIAAILVDPVMVNAGVLVTEETKLYLQKLQEICIEKKIIFILDENQTFGWLGEIFAASYFDISPDIITLGKGIAAGYPLAGVAVKEHLKTVLSYNEADFTNGGHPISCAAMIACITELQSQDLRVDFKGEYLLNKITHLKKKSEISFNHRWLGLIHCIEFDNGDEKEDLEIATKIYEGCLKKGLFLRKYNNKLVLKPSIIITESEMDKAFEIIYSEFRDLHLEFKNEN